MSCLRYGITIVCMIIFIDCSSIVLAQSIYDFQKNRKKKNNNTSTYLERQNKINSSWFSSDSSSQKSDYSNGIKNKNSSSKYLERQKKINSSWFSSDSSSQKREYSNGKYSSSQKSEYSNRNINRKIRFRLLSGNYSPNTSDTSDTQEASSSTSSIIWGDLGIGQSVIKYKGSISGSTFEIESTLIEVSYTFGDELTLTLGARAFTSGKLTLTSSDSEIFESSNVEGSGYFSVLGIEVGIFEILVGYQYASQVYTEIETESTSASWGNFKDSGGIFVTGIGLAF